MESSCRQTCGGSNLEVKRVSELAIMLLLGSYQGSKIAGEHRLVQS